MLRKAVPGSTRRSRFEIVDQHRNIQCRVDVHQQMHMIRLAAKLQQPAAPSRKDLSEGGFEVFQYLRRQGLASIFCHQDDMQLNGKNSVRTGFVRVFHIAA